MHQKLATCHRLVPAGLTHHNTRWNDQSVLTVDSDNAADKTDDGVKEFIPLSALWRKRHSPDWYGRRIARLGRAGKVGKVFA